MHVAGIRRAGDRVEMMDVGEPRALASDEVLLQVRAAGVANWDEFVRTGSWDVGGRPPMALGVEAAGTVLAAGQAVSEWAPGDAVMTHPVPLRDQGTWAPRLIAPAGLLARKPPGASWEAAAAFPVPAITAEQVLGALNIHAGEPLLVHGAGGVTGSLLAALAVLRGAEVIATAGPQADGGSARWGHATSSTTTTKIGPNRSARSPEVGVSLLRPTRHPAAPPPRSGRLPTAGAWQPSPQTRPASSAASRSPASTSARTETTCANSRSSSQTGSWRSPSPPATASPMPPRHSPRQLEATPLEPSSSRPDQPGEDLVGARGLLAG